MQQVPRNAYLMPFEWLVDASRPTNLDVRDAVLAAAAQMNATLPEDSAERVQFEGKVGVQDTTVKHFFTTPDFAHNLPQYVSAPILRKGVDDLVSQGLLRRIVTSGAEPDSRGGRPRLRSGEFIVTNQKTGEEERLQWVDYSEFELTSGKAHFDEPGIIRPQGYVWNRWPAWFGREQKDIRILLLALDLLRTNQMKGESHIHLPVLRASKSEILGAIAVLMDWLPEFWHDAPFDRAADLDPAIREAQATGVLLAEETNGKTVYVQDPRIFSSSPFGGEHRDNLAVVHGLNEDVDNDKDILHLMRVLVRWGPLRISNLFAKEGNTYKEILKLLNEPSRHSVFVSTDDLIEFAASVERNGLASYTRSKKAQKKSDKDGKAFRAFASIFTDYANTRGKYAHRAVSDALSAKAHAISRAQRIVAPNDYYIELPGQTSHGVDLTELVVRFNCAGALTPQEARLAASEVRLGLFQQLSGGGAIFTALKQVPFDDRYPVCIRCNHLAHEVDYGERLGVILLTDNPCPDLSLTCRFRLLSQ